MQTRFVNETPDTEIELFWENKHAGERRTEGTIPPRGGSIDVSTFVGHEFSYDLDGKRHYILQRKPKAHVQQQFHVLAGDDHGIHVRCTLEREPESLIGLASPHLDIMVRPSWAPRGASRFLELVREKYYDGVALNRVVPGFLTQFGIARDPEQRRRWDEKPIADDAETRKFVPGHFSFAGSDVDSRTTEVFVVMPGTDREQLDYFGTESWETPFATLAAPAEMSVLTKIYDGYGDMEPWGEGPDPDKIYDVDGYTKYLPENFPKLDYIGRCFIMDEEGAGDLSVEL